MNCDIGFENVRMYVKGSPLLPNITVVDAAGGDIHHDSGFPRLDCISPNPPPVIKTPLIFTVLPTRGAGDIDSHEIHNGVGVGVGLRLG